MKRVYPIIIKSRLISTTAMEPNYARYEHIHTQQRTIEN